MGDIKLEDPLIWKYTDKKFCDDVTQLEFQDNSNEVGIEELDRLIARREQMKSDICNQECGEQFKDCKCYKTSQNSLDEIETDEVKRQGTDRTNEVYCAMVKDGFAFACPESCCKGGLGCVEPGRTKSVNYGEDMPVQVETMNTVSEYDKILNTLDDIKKLFRLENLIMTLPILVAATAIVVGIILLINKNIIQFYYK